MSNFKIDSGSQDIQSPKSLSKMPKLPLRGSALCIFESTATGMQIESAMASEQFTILRARHGMHAYWLAIKSKPDLVVTDAVSKETSFLMECLGRNSRTRAIPVIGILDPLQSQVADVPLNQFNAVVSKNASSAELRKVADELMRASSTRIAISAKTPIRVDSVNDGVAESVDAIFSEIGHAAARRPNISPYLAPDSVTSETVGVNL